MKELNLEKEHFTGKLQYLILKGAFLCVQCTCTEELTYIAIQIVTEGREDTEGLYYRERKMGKDKSEAKPSAGGNEDRGLFASHYMMYMHMYKC